MININIYPNKIMFLESINDLKFSYIECNQIKRKPVDNDNVKTIIKLKSGETLYCENDMDFFIKALEAEEEK